MEKEIYGLLGEKLSHSYSPQIHALLGTYEYRLFEKSASDLAAFLTEAPFRGINVTIPYKKAVIPYLTVLSPEAQKIGAVNTILRTEDGLVGDNTDYYGLRYMIETSGVVTAGKKCLILGSGGASATAQAVLADLGATAVVISRSGENNYDNISRHADASVIVNTTPLGMYPQNGISPVSLDIFPALAGVFDLIYNPHKTSLILQAQDRGIRAVSGLPMLVAQAKRANELFFGRPLPAGTTETVIAKIQERTENIILIGMPGCGKSTAGKALAENMGLDFADTDEEIVRMTGRTPADIIKADGEAAFRQIEHEAALTLGKRSGTVIATGGGIVTNPKNRDPLRQNGTVVYLKRPLVDLATADRPLSAARGVEALYAARHPLYTAWADTAVEVDADPAETAKKILTAALAAKE